MRHWRAAGIRPSTFNTPPFVCWSCQHQLAHSAVSRSRRAESSNSKDRGEDRSKNNAAQARSISNVAPSKINSQPAPTSVESGNGRKHTHSELDEQVQSSSGPQGLSFGEFFKEQAKIKREEAELNPFATIEDQDAPSVEKQQKSTGKDRSQKESRPQQPTHTKAQKASARHRIKMKRQAARAAKAAKVTSKPVQVASKPDAVPPPVYRTVAPKKISPAAARFAGTKINTSFPALFSNHTPGAQNDSALSEVVENEDANSSDVVEVEKVALERARQRRGRQRRTTKKRTQNANGGRKSVPAGEEGLMVTPHAEADAVEDLLGDENISRQVTEVPADREVVTNKSAKGAVETLEASDCEMTPLSLEQPPVPRLFHDLDRVLFNRGVYQLQDAPTKVYNFDPYLQKIMPVSEFDFNALKAYKTSSKDTFLSDLAIEHGKRYVGSTSSMTGTLCHFHYLLSNWRPLDLSFASKNFSENSQKFTELTRVPNAMFLRYKGGTYAIDADKEYDGANVLMLLGKSLEKLLTMTPSDFERYRKSDPREVSDEERNAPESFHYSTQGDFLMRSQLDAYDPRLPGTGMFDLKTRAVLAIRMNSRDYEEMTGYELMGQRGQYESYEREYYDMVRSTMLKYSLQARMGRMDGIFVAYHNVKRMFGFQYINMSEMDSALHGQSDTCLGDAEFGLSIELFNRVLNKATERFPNQSIRFHFETRQSSVVPFMYIFAEPMSEQDIETIQNSQKAKVEEYQQVMMGVTPKPNEATSTDINNQPEQLSARARLIARGRVNALDNAETAHAEVGASDKAIEGDLRPILGMTLTLRSLVNGRHVQRPESLKPTDKWSIEYQLREVPSTSRAWALYEAAKGRRKAAFDKIGADLNAGDGKDAWTDGFIRTLKNISRRGRQYRNQFDLQEIDKEKVVVGGPLERTSSTASLDMDEDKHDGVTIDGVEDYIGWLYASKN